jgi:glutamate dehydrogenase
LGQLPELIGSLQYPSVAEWEMRLNLPNVPQDLARILARLEFAVPLMDIIEIAEGGAASLEQVARNYYRLEGALQLDWLRDAITGLPRDNRWQSLARSALRDDLYRMQRSLTGLALSDAGDDSAFAEKWLQRRAGDVLLCQQMLAELQAFESLDLAMLSAGMRELSNHFLA